MSEKLYSVTATEHREFREKFLARSRVDAQKTLESHILCGYVKPKKTTIVYDEVMPHERYFISVDAKYSHNYAVVDRLEDQMIGEFAQRSNAVKFRDAMNDEES